MARDTSRKLSPHKSQWLLSAMLESYPNEYLSGYLMDVRICGDCATGHVYKAFGLVPGELLVTGVITDVIRYPGRWLLKTLGRECWVVVNFAPGGRQALGHLVELFESARLAQSSWCVH